MAYIELHAHSAYSFLDGASLPEELAGAAAEAGYSAFALTDHNGLSGSMEFAQAAKGLGLKAIHGAEVDLDDGRHITLLVDTQEGWRSLCHIVTRAHAHTRDHGEPPPVRRRQSHPRRDRRRKRRLHGVVSAIGPGPLTPPAPAAAAQSSNCALRTFQRWWMERLWARLKEWRAVATRYEKTACCFMGVLCMAATLDWIK